MTGQNRRSWSCWWPFAALCLLASSRWMIAERWPETASTVASQAAGCGFAALLLFAASMFSRKRADTTTPPLRWALAGAMVVAGPFVGLLITTPPGASDLLIALSLTPVVAAVAVAASAGRSLDLAGRLWPGLAAFAGLLLMLPQPSLASLRNDAVLALSALLPALGATWLCRDAGQQTFAKWIAGLSGSGLVFGLALLLQIKFAGLHVELSRGAALLDGTLAALGLLTLLRLGTMRWAAQFALVPLVVMLEGLILLRPTIDWRILLGLGLLLAASIYLLLPPPEDDEAGNAAPLNLR